MRELLIINLKRLIKMLEDEKTIYGIGTWNCGTRSQIKSIMKQLRLDTVAYEKELYDWKKVKVIQDKYKEEK